MFNNKLTTEIDELKKQVEYLNNTIDAKDEYIDSLNNKIKELQGAEAKIKEDYRRKEEHATALLKIEQEKEIHRQVSKVKEEYNNKEKQLLEENFGKLSDSLEELHNKGNSNTKFIEKTALKMMDAVTKFNVPTALPAPAEEPRVQNEWGCYCKDDEYCEICS